MYLLCIYVYTYSNMYIHTDTQTNKPINRPAARCQAGVDTCMAILGHAASLPHKSSVS